MQTRELRGEHAGAQVLLDVGWSCPGYHVTADRAWAGRIYEQFKASKQNALFIVMDGPSNKKQGPAGQVQGAVRRAVTGPAPRPADPPDAAPDPTAADVLTY